MDTTALESAGIAPRRRRLIAALVGALIVLTPATARTQPDTDMNDLAERYVKLVLAMGRHDGDYVDAYYGLRRRGAPMSTPGS